MDRQGISQYLYKKHNSKWFTDKTAVALRDLHGKEGEVIKASQVVTIKRKWSGFIVMSESGACVWRVPPDAIELLSPEETLHFQFNLFTLHTP